MGGAAEYSSPDRSIYTSSILQSQSSLSIACLLFLGVRRPQCRPVDVWALQVQEEPWREVWRLDAQLGEVAGGGMYDCITPSFPGQSADNDASITG